MILFVSDMHFGRGDPATERAEERALIEFLCAFEDDVEHLFLLGDVFDEYIEYSHLVPKGFARLQGLLAAWTDGGRPVTYIAGNHDPWHIDYFQKELGVRVLLHPMDEPLQGKHVYLLHGDGIASRFPLFAWIKRALQHPLPVRLYRALLPGDSGYRLARWVNRRIHTDVIDHEVVEALRRYAHAMLTRHSYDLILMGHSHYAERIDWPEGTYVNTGSWRLARTFACLNDQGIELLKWNGSRSNTQTLSADLSWSPPANALTETSR